MNDVIPKDDIPRRSTRAGPTPSDPAALTACLAESRPQDIVDLLNREKPAFNAAILLALPEAKAVEVLDQPRLALGAAILSNLPPDRGGRLLDLMSADRAAAIVREMRVSVRNNLLAVVRPETKAAIEQLLPYRADCAGAIMTTEFVAVPSDWTVEQVLAHVRVVEYTRETVYAIYILDPRNGALLASVPLRRLIATDPNSNVLAASADLKPLMIAPDAPLDEALRLISKYNLLALPVVDAARHAIGIVTVDDAVDTLVARQDAEVQHFGGMEPLHAPYMRIGFFEMIRKRAGWLCLLFLAEMLTASAMQTYEDELQKAIVLSLFIPLIMSSGGNSGSQATSLIIRALAVQDVRLGDWWRVMLRELPAGIILGVILGVIGATRVGLWQGLGLFDYGPHWRLVALTIASTLIGIVTFGSLAGSLLPFLLKRMGFDPANASAPFIATLVDVTGIVIYFTVASFVLRGTLL
jgi:magnesium transporter